MLTAKTQKKLLVLAVLLTLVTTGMAQTKINGNALAYRSNGALVSPSAWRMTTNGFLGTFITIPGTNAATVTFTIAASKSSSDPNSPKLRLRVADSNQTYSVTATGTKYANYATTWTLPPGTHVVRLEYINRAQTLQLNIASLTVSNATVLNTASDSNALAAADTYIANYRQGPVMVTLVNTNGQPLINSSVRFKLQRHAFNFGTAVYGTSSGDASWPWGSGANDVNYRNFLVDNFNSIEPENAGKWPWNEAVSNVVTMDFVDTLRDFAVWNNQRIRMHNVLWGAATPTWANNLIYTATNSASTPAQVTAATNALRQAISSRIQYYLVQTNRGLGYGELDGINESVHQPIFTQIYGLAGVAGINNEIKQALNSMGAPTKNFVNEYNVLQWSTDAYANWYLQHIESLRTSGATNSITGIGVQYYVDLSSAADQYSPHSPSRMMSVFDNLSAESTPLSLTEYGCLTTNATAQRVATTLAETVRMVFGHDQMNTFNLWGFWYPEMWANGGPLVDANWNLTLSGQTWQQMMGVTNWGLAGVPVWTTDVTLTTDAQGKATFTGYYGDYTASSSGGIATFTATKGAINNVTATNTFITFLDQLANNPPWGVTSLQSGDNFVSLTGDGGSANVVYGAAKTGGLIEYYYSGSWQSVMIAINLFKAVTCDASLTNVVFGAPATGGLVRYAWNGSSWNASTVDGDTSHVYVALTHDTANQNTVYGAAAAGGVYEITYTGFGPYGGWSVNLLTPTYTAYKQLTIDGVGLTIYGLTTDGFIDQIYYQGTWQTFRVDTNTYVSITGENNVSNTVFGARTGGGLYQMQYTGSGPNNGWAINTIDAMGNYQALTDNTSIANAIFGASGDTVYSIYYGGGWNISGVIAGKYYSTLATDGVRSDALFGIR
jgi:GH35 family endo-1,4-beta-xylanase